MMIYTYIYNRVVASFKVDFLVQCVWPCWWVRFYWAKRAMERYVVVAKSRQNWVNIIFFFIFLQKSSQGLSNGEYTLSLPHLLLSISFLVLPIKKKGFNDDVTQTFYLKLCKYKLQSYKFWKFCPLWSWINGAWSLWRIDEPNFSWRGIGRLCLAKAKEGHLSHPLRVSCSWLGEMPVH